MSKFFIYILLFTLATVAKAEEPGNKINPDGCLQLAFENQFGCLDNVSWYQTIDELTRADFSRNGKSYAAYFDKDNQYVSTVRVLKPWEFPIDIYLLARNQLNGYCVVNVVEFWNTEMHVYFIEGKSKLKSQVVMLKAGNAPDGLLVTLNKKEPVLLRSKHKTSLKHKMPNGHFA